jgi:hypothetical protein
MYMSAKRDLRYGLNFSLGIAARGAENTMSTIHSSKYPIGRWTLWRQDMLMVSAFVVWAVILGLIPVLAFGALIAA